MSDRMQFGMRDWADIEEERARRKQRDTKTVGQRPHPLPLGVREAEGICRCGHQKPDHQVWTANMAPNLSKAMPGLLPFYAGCTAGTCDCVYFKVTA